MAVKTEAKPEIDSPAEKTKPRKVKVTPKRPTFNKETMAAIRDALTRRNLKRYPSAEALFEDLGI
jgi:hypothetical protein